MLRYCFCFILSALIYINGQSQESFEKPSDGAILGFGFGLGINNPYGDLKKRYGSNLNFSLGCDYITKNNWIITGEFMYFFGDNIKEDVLAPFRNSNGTIPGDDNQTADVFLRERGLFLGAGIGKLFPFSQESRSGIKLLINAGVLQHNIRFTDERNSVAQIRAGRYKGYDRLTRGFAIKETVAYKHLSKDRRLNFEFALDFIQGFTDEVRAYNFDTGLPTIKSRFDMLVGARIIWNLPFYRGGEETVFY